MGTGGNSQEIEIGEETERMKIDNIVLLTESPFTRRDYARFGVKLLNNNNIKVEVWDLTGIIHPGYDVEPPDPLELPEILVFREKEEVRKRIYALEKEKTLVINLNSGWLDRLWLFRLLTKHSIRYAVMALGIIPYFNVDSTARKKDLFKMLFRFKPSNLGIYIAAALNKFIRKIPFNWFGVAPASFILTSGTFSVHYYPFPIDDSTEVIWLHAWDYDLYLEENKKPVVPGPRKTAVFLDAYMPYHPDAVLLNEKNFVIPNNYFRTLGKFFDSVELDRHIRVEIAAHPRADYSDKPGCYGDRALYFGKAAERVRASEFVIAHSSTALNFAILYNKPVIFVYTREMAMGGYALFIENMASWYGKRAYNLDEPCAIDWQDELKVDDALYERLRESFIKKKGSPEAPIWQIVADRFHNVTHSKHAF
jgi:hypothetical protein